MCRVLIVVFALCYLIAFALALIGTFGLFGVERDPLSGIFLIPLGLPWNILLEDAGEAFLPWIGALAPLLNITILAFVCRYFRTRGS